MEDWSGIILELVAPYMVFSGIVGFLLGAGVTYLFNRRVN